MTSPGVSPLAPARFPAIPPVPGVRIATRACGLRYHGRDDVLLMDFAAGTSVGGVLTRSTTAAAPVDWCRRGLAGGRARALIVNAGNANAFTGDDGMRAVERVTTAVGAELAVPADQVFMASTGVIGQPLPDAKITAHLASLHADLDGDGAAWEAAARAIMTTDTFPKGATAGAVIDGRPVIVAGIAKGSGMIAPDMATMLAFVATDAAIASGTLQRLIADAADRTFNCTTVDGDTSTSDTLLAFATGAAGNAPVEDPADLALAGFRAALEAVCRDLALQVVRDGEGASRFVTITITGAESDAAARRIGLAIANSPLVKTAIAGADANWGRIVMAVGKSGERAVRDRLVIAIGGVVIARLGGAVPGYDETPVARHMQGREIEIAVDVAVGEGRASVWTCDLTHGYIDINGAYRS